MCLSVPNQMLLFSVMQVSEWYHLHHCMFWNGEYSCISCIIVLHLHDDCTNKAFFRGNCMTIKPGVKRPLKGLKEIGLLPQVNCSEILTFWSLKG